MDGIVHAAFKRLRRNIDIPFFPFVSLTGPLIGRFRGNVYVPFFMFFPILDPGAGRYRGYVGITRASIVGGPFD